MVTYHNFVWLIILPVIHTENSSLFLDKDHILISVYK